MKKMSRRAFIKGSLLAATGTCVCGMVGYGMYHMMGHTPAIQKQAYFIDGRRVFIDPAKESRLIQMGGSVKMIDPRLNDAMIIAHSSQNQFIAASIHCTHGGIEVEYHHEESLFRCPSIGGSQFKLNGKKISGPAKRDLKQYELIRLDHRLVINI